MPNVAEIGRRTEEDRLAQQKDLEVPGVGTVRVVPPRLEVIYALEKGDPIAWSQAVIAASILDDTFDGLRVAGLSRVAIDTLAQYVAETQGVEAAYRRLRNGSPEQRLYDVVTSAMRERILPSWGAISPDTFAVWGQATESLRQSTMSVFTPDMLSLFSQATESIHQTTAMIGPALRAVNLGMGSTMNAYASILNPFFPSRGQLFLELDTGIGAIAEGLRLSMQSGALFQMADFLRQTQDVDFGIRSPWLNRADITKPMGEPFTQPSDRTLKERDADIVDVRVESPRNRWEERKQQELERDLRIVQDLCNGVIQTQIARGEVVPVSEIRAATERTMRRVIVRVLRKKYGDDWWTLGVPSEIRGDAENLFEKDLTARATSFRVGETLLGKTFVLQLSVIIRHQPNWVDGFDAVFNKVDKNRVDSWFHDFNETRRQETHSGSISDLHMQAAAEAARKLVLPVWLFQKVPTGGPLQA